MSLDEAVAFVTGASSGIGAATAKRLADHGCKVVVAARREERLQKLTKEIVRGGGNCCPVYCDVSDLQSVEAALQESVRKFGGLDIVINNAGLMMLGQACDVAIEDWRRMVDTNVIGAMNVTKVSLPYLVAAASTSPRGCADLINISSTAANDAFPSGSGYNFTKFGLRGFTESLRQEIRDSRVRVSSIEPGTVATELFKQMPLEVRQALPSTTPEPLAASDVADAILFIISKPRAVHISKITIRPTLGI